MEERPTTIRIPSIGKGDQLILAQYVGQDNVTFEEQSVPEGTHGEIGMLTAILIMSSISLKGYIGYLIYKHHGETFEEEIELETPSGGRLKRRIRYRKSEGESAEAALAKELSSLGNDMSQLISHG